MLIEKSLHQTYTLFTEVDTSVHQSPPKVTRQLMSLQNQSSCCTNKTRDTQIYYTERWNSEFVLQNYHLFQIARSHNKFHTWTKSSRNVHAYTLQTKTIPRTPSAKYCNKCWIQTSSTIYNKVCLQNCILNYQNCIDQFFCVLAFLNLLIWSFSAYIYRLAFMLWIFKSVLSNGIVYLYL